MLRGAAQYVVNVNFAIHLYNRTLVGLRSDFMDITTRIQEGVQYRMSASMVCRCPSEVRDEPERLFGVVRYAALTLTHTS